MNTDIRARKAALRTSMRERRRNLAPVARQRFDNAIADHLLDRVAQENPSRVAGYLAFDGEPDLMPALMAMDRCGISVAVPVLETRRPPTMHFRLWSPAEALRNNAVGIAEPESGTRIDIGELDIVLLPLVAWSPAGARLGMGGGYYDRILSGVGGEGPRRFGIAYDCQKVEDVPREPWDEPLHGIITESGWRPLPDRNQDRNQDQDRDKDGD